jgi:hypothetical protein
MNEVMRTRVIRMLENLPDETAYQVVDYIEFLERKYGTGAAAASPLRRLAEGVEDTLRATRVPVAAIRGTLNVVDTATRLMEGLASAGRAAVDELRKTAAESDRGAPPPPPGGPGEGAPPAP